MNTTEFNRFKLHSDSTLKLLNKDELIEYIHMLYHNWSATDESYNNAMEYAKTLQDEIDYYKHEYYSECDRAEKPEELKMLTKEVCMDACTEICEDCQKNHEKLYGIKGIACAFQSFDNEDCPKVATFKRLIKEHFELLKVIEKETEYIQKVIDLLGNNFVTVSKLKIKIAIVELEAIQDSLIGHHQDVAL